MGERWGHDIYRGELSHAYEHSIEFQTVYLRSLGLAGENLAPMISVLCDSLHGLVLPPHSPSDVAIVCDFVNALRSTIAEDGRRTTIIAAVDLAHVRPSLRRRLDNGLRAYGSGWARRPGDAGFCAKD